MTKKKSAKKNVKVTGSPDQKVPISEDQVKIEDDWNGEETPKEDTDQKLLDDKLDTSLVEGVDMVEGVDSESRDTQAKEQVAKDEISEEPTTEKPKSEEIRLEEPVIEVRESTPESASTTQAIAVPKKRLTLQERLALAAKSGKSKRSVSENVKAKERSSTPESRSTPITPVLSNTETFSGPTSPSVASTPKPSLEIARSLEAPGTEERPTLFTINLKGIPQDDLLKLITEAENRYTSLVSKNKSLKEEKLSLQEKIRNISSTTNFPSIQPSSYNEHIIKEKDDKIARLMKEGQELSVKELKYNNTIKKLKLSNSQNESELANLQKKITSLEEQRKELKDLLKASQAAEKEATAQSKTLQLQLKTEKDALNEQISKNKELSTKLEELNLITVQEKNQYAKEVNLLNKSLEKEKQKFAAAKEDHLKEVARLEERVEHLRFQSENAQTKSTCDESYLKLTRQYETLQKQYTSATENWQSIEATLQRRIIDFEGENNLLRQKLEEDQSKIQVLSKDLKFKTSEITDLNAKVSSLVDEQNKIQIRFQSVSQSLEEAEENLEDQERKHRQEKNQLEYKIETLQKQIKDSIEEQTLNVSGNLYQNPSQTPGFLYSRQDSTTSTKFREIGFGESSLTPSQSRKSSVFFQNNSNSNVSHSHGDEEDITDLAGSDTVASPVQSRLDNHSSSAIGGSSVQLLGKLSGQVRRLETELSLLKEELEKANEDKKEANEEIVRLMKDNEEVGNYKAEIELLKKDVQTFSHKYERTLEILGEKSEQVEELKADVIDLKDLLKLQVQQLVELQSK